MGTSCPKPDTKPAIYLLLRSLLLNFSEAWFQESIQQLQRRADAPRCGRTDPDGYYHLAGRAELAMQVQKLVLPHFGFEATKEGVADMIRHCAAFLSDQDVAHLFDAINKKLGMSPAACQRFRRLAASLE
ncbi:Ankrd17, partial [Symbiodinium necroappetens]